MAVITTTSYVNYKAGTSGVSSVVGYESSSNRVVRFQFTSPSGGASAISLKLNLSHGDGSYSPLLRYYITTSSTSHANANSGAAYHGTLSISLESGVYVATGSANVVLVPNTMYYLWIFPGDTTYSWWGHYGEATITTSGGAGLVYIDNGSGFDAYQCYIDNGTDWDLYIPYIDNGTGWDLYS